MEDNLTGEEVLAIFRQISPQTEEIVMSAYERTVEEINFETVKNLIKEGLVTDLERLRKALKLSEKKMDRNGEPWIFKADWIGEITVALKWYARGCLKMWQPLDFNL